MLKKNNRLFLLYKEEKLPSNDLFKPKKEFLNKNSKQKNINLINKSDTRAKKKQETMNLKNMIMFYKPNDSSNLKILNHSVFSRDNVQKLRKIIISKSNLLSKIINSESQKKLRQNYNLYSNTFNTRNKKINISSQKSNSNIFGSQEKVPLFNLGLQKMDSIKKKNENSFFNTNNNEVSDITTNLSKFDPKRISLNKTALIRKLRFQGLKKFCLKNCKSYDSNQQFDVGIAHSQKLKEQKIKDLENYEKIQIDSIKRKVIAYYKHKFNNTKVFFNDWDKQNKGKIRIYDIFRYLNDKIRVKISIGEANNIFKKCCNKDYYLDYEHFKNFFFDEKYIRDTEWSNMIIKNSKHEKKNFFEDESQSLLNIFERNKTKILPSKNGQKSSCDNFLTLLKDNTENDKVYNGENVKDIFNNYINTNNSAKINLTKKNNIKREIVKSSSCKRFEIYKKNNPMQLYEKMNMVSRKKNENNNDTNCLNINSKMIGLNSTQEINGIRLSNIQNNESEEKNNINKNSSFNELNFEQKEMQNKINFRNPVFYLPKLENKSKNRKLNFDILDVL
jgi:hypothetical protein